MSTRCQITIEGQPIYLYRHSDGYPNGPHGVLEPLKEFTKKFFNLRGYDPEYFMAQLTGWFIRKNDEQYAKMAAAAEEKGDASGSKYYKQFSVLGYGLDTVLHFDIEYLYTVSKTGKIKITGGPRLQQLLNAQTV